MEGFEILQTLILIQIISTMTSIGLGLNLKQIKNVLSNYNLLARATPRNASRAFLAAAFI